MGLKAMSLENVRGSTMTTSNSGARARFGDGYERAPLDRPQLFVLGTVGNHREIDLSLGHTVHIIGERIERHMQDDLDHLGLAVAGSLHALEIRCRDVPTLAHDRAGKLQGSL